MTDFQMQTDLAEALKRMQQENTSAARITIANDYAGKYHIHFKQKVREDIAMGKLSRIMNEAQKGNISHLIDGMVSNDEQSGHAIQGAFSGDGGPGASGQNPMGQMMQGMQQGAQAGQQALQGLAGNFKLDNLTKMPESVFKGIEQIVKTAGHGGGASHDASHDTDNDDAHHKDHHDVDTRRDHSQPDRSQNVTVTSSEKPLTLTVTPQDTNAGSGSGAPSTLASPPASHDAAAPAAPIDAGLVAPDEGNPSDASGDSLAAPSVDTASAEHDTEESASVGGSRNYHNEAHW